MQVNDRLVQNRVHPIRRDLDQRGKHESALLQSRMRQYERFRRLVLMRVSRKGHPLPENARIGQNHLAHSQKIKIKHPRAPARSTDTTCSMFNGMKM